MDVIGTSAETTWLVPATLPPGTAHTSRSQRPEGFQSEVSF